MGAEKIYNSFLSAAKAHTRLQIHAFLQVYCVGPDMNQTVCKFYQQTTLVQMIVDINGR